MSYKKIHSMHSLVDHLKKKSQNDDDFSTKRFLKKKTKLPQLITAEITGIDSMGDLIARPVNEYKKFYPQITIIKDQVNPPVGIGDLVRIHVQETSHKIYTGIALKRLNTSENKIIGVFKNGFLIPADRRLTQTFKLSGYTKKELKNGDLILSEIPLFYTQDPTATFIKKIGSEYEPFAPTQIAIALHNLPTDFSEKAQKEAQQIPFPLKGTATHPDETNIPFITIDGSDARDFDDAVFAEQDPSPTNKNGWHILVAIADVSYYVRPDSELDREAYKRGNSVYFPDRAIPMLPFELSSGVCSLNPNEPRYALICDITLDKNGNKIKHHFRRALVKSKQRLTYDEVQAALDGRKQIPELEQEITALNHVYKLLSRKRRERGVLEIDSPEREIILSQNGHVRNIKLREQTDSMKLIEELMILSNVAAAETLEEKHAPTIYRIHDHPSIEKIDILNNFLQTLKLPVKTLTQSSETSAFNSVLSRFEKRPERFAVHEYVLRSQSQACYSPENIGHFGLALSKYVHFTSPIRRYADLVIHRSLISVLHLKSDNMNKLETDVLDSVAEHISRTERQASSAERDAVDRYIACYMSDKIDSAFNAIITSVTEFGLFVRTDKGHADGFIPMRALTDDFYDFDTQKQELVGRSTGHKYRIGHSLQVILKEVAPITGGLLFKPKSFPQSATRLRHKKKKKRLKSLRVKQR